MYFIIIYVENTKKLFSYLKEETGHIQAYDSLFHLNVNANTNKGFILCISFIL